MWTFFERKFNRARDHAELVSFDRVRQLLYSYRVNPGSAGRRGLRQRVRFQSDD